MAKIQAASSKCPAWGPVPEKACSSLAGDGGLLGSTVCQSRVGIPAWQGEISPGSRMG